jgi:hypothetical protein
MDGEPTKNLRVIIQYIRADIPKYSRYRLIAYGSETFRPAESVSFAELSQRFESAGIPPEHRPIPLRLDLTQTTIVFSADLALTLTQFRFSG